MRKQRPRGAITRETVVNAALSLLDKRGMERFTVRALARIVDVPPMSLYTHFANKEELLDLMYAEITRRIYEDEQHPTWQGELSALSKRVLRILGDHARWIDLLSRSAAPGTVAMRERVLGLMIADSLSPDAAIHGLAAVILTSIGLVLANFAMSGGKGKATFAARFAKFKSAFDKTSDTGDAITRLASSKVARFDLEAELEFSIRTLIVGLETNHELRAASRTARVD